MPDQLSPKYGKAVGTFVEVMEKNKDHEVRRKILGDFMDTYLGISILWGAWLG